MGFSRVAYLAPHSSLTVDFIAVAVPAAVLVLEAGGLLLWKRLAPVVRK